MTFAWKPVLGTTSVAAALLMGAYAALAAGQTTPMGGGAIPNPYGGGTTHTANAQGRCADGFIETASNGAPPGAYYFTCTTPVIKCPAPVGDEKGGMATPTAQSVSGGARFSYTCSYQLPPR